MIRFFAALLAASLALPGAAAAQTFDLSFNGADTTGGSTYGSTAIGSFTLDGAANGTYALSDVTNFSLAMIEPSAYGIDNFAFGLADLDAFNATITDGQITSLVLQTDIQSATYNYNEGLWVFDLGAGDTYAYNFDLPIAEGTISVTAEAVPEPASLAAFGAGLAALGLARRRFAR